MRRDLILRPSRSVLLGEGLTGPLRVDLRSPPIGFVGSLVRALPFPDAPTKAQRSPATGTMVDLPDEKDPEYLRGRERVGTLHALIGIAECLEQGENEGLREDDEPSIFGHLSFTEDFGEHVRDELTAAGVDTAGFMRLVEAFNAVASPVAEVEEAAEVF